MDYFFKSKGCPGCSYVFGILERDKENWTGYLKIVDVEFDSKTKKLMTYIDNEEAGESPTGVVPAFYSSENDEFTTGTNAVMEKIKNASWNNKS